MRGDSMHPPIPPDPYASPCQVEYQMPGGNWVECGEYADEEVEGTLMCEEHINDHYRCEEADLAIKRRHEDKREG